MGQHHILAIRAEIEAGMHQRARLFEYRKPLEAPQFQDDDNNRGQPLCRRLLGDPHNMAHCE
jgi:hypothetical protein